MRGGREIVFQGPSTEMIATGQKWTRKGDPTVWEVVALSETGLICLRSGSRTLYLQDEELLNGWELEE